jgi:hypothetical protein
MLVVKKALRLSRNWIPIQRFQSAAAIPGRTAHDRKSGVSVTAPFG